MPEQSQAAGSRGRLILIEVILFALTVSLLIWQPLGQVGSLMTAIILALLFIGLFPAMLKGNRVAEAEREHLERRFGDKDSL